MNRPNGSRLLTALQGNRTKLGTYPITWNWKATDGTSGRYDGESFHCKYSPWRKYRWLKSFITHINRKFVTKKPVRLFPIVFLIENGKFGSTSVTSSGGLGSTRPVQRCGWRCLELHLTVLEKKMDTVEGKSRSLPFTVVPEFLWHNQDISNDTRGNVMKNSEMRRRYVDFYAVKWTE